MCDLLRVENLRGGYGRRAILHGLSFSLAPGELCALMGPNGSGKSTLLRGVCGLIPTQGSCRLDGKELAGLPGEKRAARMAYLPQRWNSTLALTALEVVLMGFNPVLGLLERPSAAQKARALEVMEDLGAGELAGREFLSLSEGQRQLVLLSRTLVRKARLLVLDEPDGPLDYPNRRRVVDYLARTAREWGAGVLWCSHDANFALRYAHRLLLLREGSLSAQVDLGHTSCGELAQALGAIYGPVEVFTRGGRYLMTDGDDG